MSKFPQIFSSVREDEMGLYSVLVASCFQNHCKCLTGNKTMQGAYTYLPIERLLPQSLGGELAGSRPDPRLAKLSYLISASFFPFFPLSSMLDKPDSSSLPPKFSHCCLNTLWLLGHCLQLPSVLSAAVVTQWVLT